MKSPSAVSPAATHPTGLLAIPMYWLFHWLRYSTWIRETDKTHAQVIHKGEVQSLSPVSSRSLQPSVTPIMRGVPQAKTVAPRIHTIMGLSVCKTGM